MITQLLSLKKDQLAEALCERNELAWMLENYYEIGMEYKELAIESSEVNQAFVKTELHMNRLLKACLDLIKEVGYVTKFDGNLDITKPRPFIKHIKTKTKRW